MRSLYFCIFFSVVFCKEIYIIEPRSGKFPESHAKGCGWTDFDGPVVSIGNFTDYGLKLEDFNANVTVLVTLNETSSYYKLKDDKQYLKEFNLYLDPGLQNNTQVWNSFREYRTIFERGLHGPVDIESHFNVNGDDIYVIIIPTVTLKRDGTIRFINYVAASTLSEGYKGKGPATDPPVIVAYEEEMKKLQQDSDLNDLNAQLAINPSNFTADLDSNRNEKEYNSWKMCAEASVVIKSVTINFL